MSFAGKRIEREQTTFARLAAGTSRTLGAFLSERIPLSASLAFALPTTECGPAVLADESETSFGHGNRLEMANRTLMRL
jgi:hypothetical protein